MTAFFAVLRNEVRLMFHSWRTLLLMLALPVLMLLVVVGALAPLREESSFVRPFALAFVDQEQSVWTEMLVGQLERISLIGEVLKVDEAEAIRLIREGRAAAAIVVPEGLSGQVNLFQPVSIKVYGSSRQSLQSNIILHVCQAGADLVSSGMASLEVIREAELRAGVPPEVVAADLEANYASFFQRVLGRREVFGENRKQAWAVTLVEYYAAGLMAVFLLFASLPCMKRSVEDRQNGVLRRYLSAPAPVWAPLLSRLLVSLMVSALQFSLLVAVTALAFRSYWNVPPFYTIGLFLATVTASAGFSLLVANLSDSPATVDVAGWLGVLVMAVAGGSLYPPAAMPDWVQPLSAFAVVRWTREGFMGIFTGQTGEIGRCMAMLFLLAAGFLLSALLVSRFRKRRA